MDHVNETLQPLLDYLQVQSSLLALALVACFAVLALFLGGYLIIIAVRILLSPFTFLRWLFRPRRKRLDIGHFVVDTDLPPGSYVDNRGKLIVPSGTYEVK